MELTYILSIAEENYCFLHVSQGKSWHLLVYDITIDLKKILRLKIRLSAFSYKVAVGLHHGLFFSKSIDPTVYKNFGHFNFFSVMFELTRL